MSLPPIPPAQPGKPAAAAARKAAAAAAAPPFSSSWPCASLHRRPPPSPARPRPRPQPQPRGRSCESLCAAAAAGPGAGEAALRLSLSLPPEAARVLQRRSLEKQQRRLPPGARGKARAGPAGGDLRARLKISLLNERHRYDDVEYEEEAAPAPADEGLVRKCTEWLRGVESAAGRERDRETLPHLGAL